MRFYQSIQLQPAVPEIEGPEPARIPAPTPATAAPVTIRSFAMTIEDGKIPLRAGSYARSRSLDRNARDFDTALRRKVGASQGKGHPKPPPSHLQAIYLGGGCDPQATFKPPSSHPQATLKPFPDQMRQGLPHIRARRPPAPTRNSRAARWNNIRNSRKMCSGQGGLALSILVL